MHLTYLNIGTGFDPSLGFVQRTGRIAETGVDFTHRPESFLGIREQSYGLSGFAAVDQKRKWDSYVVTVQPDQLAVRERRAIRGIDRADRRPPSGSVRRVRLARQDDHDPPVSTGGRATTSPWPPPEAPDQRRPPPVLRRLLQGHAPHPRGERLAPTGLGADPAALRRAQCRQAAPGDFTQFLYSVRLELKISPQFQITNVAQYDNESQSLGSATRLRWTFLRQGDVFVAFDTNYKQITKSTHTRWDFQSDHFMIKFRYALRV